MHSIRKYRQSLKFLSSERFIYIIHKGKDKQKKETIKEEEKFKSIYLYKEIWMWKTQGRYIYDQ